MPASVNSQTHAACVMIGERLGLNLAGTRNL